MKRIISFFTLLSCLGLCFQASAQVFQNGDLTVTKLEPNMWILETNTECTMYLVEGSEKAMLIDAGTHIRKFDSIIRQITQKPLVVVLTHAHGDHTGNIDYFDEIWLHPADTVLLNRRNKSKINFIKDGDIFDLGGTKLEVSHTPAHTPGSIVLLDKKMGICYSGDSFGANHAWLQLQPNSPLQTYVNSCLKMENYLDNGITKVYCGHYCYPKKAYDKTYITSMRQLAEGLINGTGPTPTPYENKTGCRNPMSVTSGEATLVFDPDFVKTKKI